MTDEQWIELLNNMEPILFTTCSDHDWLIPDDRRIRNHIFYINGLCCSVYLDFKEVQWTGVFLYDRIIINPESLFVKEHRNEKSTSS